MSSMDQETYKIFVYYMYISCVRGCKRERGRKSWGRASGVITNNCHKSCCYASDDKPRSDDITL